MQLIHKYRSKIELVLEETARSDNSTSCLAQLASILRLSQIHSFEYNDLSILLIVSSVWVKILAGIVRKLPVTCG